MSHTFFNHSFAPQSYTLNVMPNAIHNGLLVEADEDGTILAVKFSDGQTMRQLSSYIVHRTPTENLLIDIQRIVHPLD